MVFEFINVEGDSGFTKTAFMEFGKIVLFGTTFGFTFAHGLAFAINKKFIPHYLLNVVSLSVVLLVFVESEIFAHESGLLAVVVMGMVLGNGKLENLKELLYFKESLSVLLISILFILLAANINIEDLYLLYNWETIALFLIVVLIIRPLAVFASAQGSNLKLNERLFVSWVGPRGIVAAGIASLFGSKLMKQGVEGAEYITPLVFMIVLGTVLLNATTARFFAKIVGVFLTKSDGILIVGASKVSRSLAKYLDNNGRNVVVIDSNQTNIEKAREMGLEAISTDIYTNTLNDNIELNDVGYLMALTGSSDINRDAINKFGKQFGENGSFRLVSKEEMRDENNNPKEGLFSHTDDYESLTNVSKKYPSVQEVLIENKEHYQSILELTKSDKDIIPIFLKDTNDELIIISSDNSQIEVGEDWKLIYLGKPIDVEKIDL